MALPPSLDCLSVCLWLLPNRGNVFPPRDVFVDVGKGAEAAELVGMCIIPRGRQGAGERRYRSREGNLNGMQIKATEHVESERGTDSSLLQRVVDSPILSSIRGKFISEH